MLGDSITESRSARNGEKVSDYTKTTINSLSMGRNEWLIINEGKGNETIQRALKRIDSILARERPEFLSIAYGLIDASKKDPVGFQGSVIQLINTVHIFDPNVVIILVATVPIDESIHFYGKNRYFKKYGGANRYINNHINGILRNIAFQNNLPFINMFRFLEEREEWRDSISMDGIHPNAAGNRLIGEYIGRVLYTYYSARMRNDENAVQAENDAHHLMKAVVQRFFFSRGNEVLECIEMEERAWQLCPYLPDMTRPILLSILSSYK